MISGLKRFKDDEEMLEKFIKSHVLRLLKLDMIAVLTELERQEEVTLAIKVVTLIFSMLKVGVFLHLLVWVVLKVSTLGL